MNQEEFESLIEKSVLPNSISVNDLENQSDRTLIYGYTLDRYTFHVYLLNKLFYLYIYDFERKTVRTLPGEGNIDIDRCTPSKRAYPEACDAEFCRLVIKNGGHIPFTVFNPDREPKQFHGELL